MTTGKDLTSPIIDSMKQFVAIQFQEIAITPINFTQRQSSPRSIPVYIICEVSSLAELLAALQLYDSSFDESINYFIVGAENVISAVEKSQSPQLLLAQQYFNFSKSDNFPGYVCRITFVFASNTEELNAGASDVTFTNSIILGTICYLCGSKDYILKYSLQLTNNTTSILIELHENFKELSNNGHESRLNFISFTNHVNDVTLCEYNVMFLVKSDCYHIHAILNLVISKTNLTWSNSFSLESFNTYTGPVRVDASSNFELHTIKSVKLLLVKLYEVESLKFLYCDESVQFEGIQHSIVVDRVHKLVWLLVIILSATLGILNGSIFSGFGIFFIMIDQPINIQGMFKRPRILSPAFAIIFLSWWYRSMISTDMIAPSPPKVISTCKELFNAGYKFLVRSEQDLVYFNAGAYDDVKQRCKVELSKENFIMNQILATKLTQFSGSQPYQEVAKIKGIMLISGTHAMALKKVQSVAKRSTNLLSCNILKQNLRMVHNMMYFKSYLKSRILWVNDAIYAAGIFNLYTSRIIDRLISASNFVSQNCTNSNDINCKLEIGLSLHSPIIIGFYALICFLSVSGLLLVIELCCRVHSTQIC
ncbi:unnamed protein product [Orchesella dallaii]|uniref:Uncharacterized protein n=1 Tax=Orchesella dallaii TaxID=48710 RepID=A0ABP1QDY7_9HEXA